MSDFLVTTTIERPKVVIPSAQQPGGAVPTVIGTPRVSEPRRPGDPPPAYAQHVQRLRAEREQPCCVCRGSAVDEKLPPNRVALICGPHREERRRAIAAARVARSAVKLGSGGEPTRRPRSPNGTPQSERVCTHCDRPRAKYGSYCAEHKTQYARERRRGVSPPVRTIDAPRAADVIAARRAARAKAVPEILNTDLLEPQTPSPPTKEQPMAQPATKTCTHCEKPRLASGPYCSDHKRQKNDEYLARKAQGASKKRGALKVRKATLAAYEKATKATRAEAPPEAQSDYVRLGEKQLGELDRATIDKAVEQAQRFDRLGEEFAARPAHVIRMERIVDGLRTAMRLCLDAKSSREASALAIFDAMVSALLVG